MRKGEVEQKKDEIEKGIRGKISNKASKSFKSQKKRWLNQDSFILQKEDHIFLSAIYSEE